MLALSLKRFFVDRILEPVVPLHRVESHLMFWARVVCRVRKPFIIGITGSVGKSTTTSMIAAALCHPDAERGVGSVACTFGNMNDNVGVSATVLRYRHVLRLPWQHHRRLALLFSLPLRALQALVRPYPKIMVLEFGVCWESDFQRLVTIARPSISVVTRIGAAHLEKLKTLDGVVQEKGVLVRAVLPSGLVVLGQDHDFVSQLEKMSRAPVVKVSGPGIELSRNITRAVCRHMGLADEVIDSALRKFRSPAGRLSRRDIAGLTVIDDTYNANPLSMKLGLDTLAQSAPRDRRQLVILGYMGELGDDAPRYHHEVGAYARRRADIVVGIGELAKHYDPDTWFANSDACADQIDSLIRAGDCILVKGSASSRMQNVVKKLHEIAETQGASPANVAAWRHPREWRVGPG